MQSACILWDVFKDEILQFCLLERESYVHLLVIGVFSEKRQQDIWNEL